MCGFAGGTDPSWNYAAALASIVHRGPDDGRLHLEGAVRVGFRRLSIIDLDAAANQPMFADDGQTWIVFNGEIYGFIALRRELERHGHTFRTHSDTEVLLHAYLQWGDEFIEHVDGMFAIALWDARDRKLRLFRDRPGIKPLYYYYDGQRFAFASELKAIEALVDANDLQVDDTALYDFLGYRYVPAPKTLYRNCFKLPPAHYLVYDPATGVATEPRRYWSIPIPSEPLDISADAAAEQLHALLDESVRDQMISDVPLGFFLSGGVDSSTVVATAAGLDADISTFSIGFDSDEKSETPYAREVAELFGTQHHQRMLTQDAAVDLLPSLKHWFDEPFADESALPTFLVSKVAKENVTVVLTGDGGDEVFGGYRTYPRFRALQPPAVLTAGFRGVCVPPAQAVRPAQCDRENDASPRVRVQHRSKAVGKDHARSADSGEGRLPRASWHPGRLRRLVALPRALARRVTGPHETAARRFQHLHAGHGADQGRPHQHGGVT